MTTLKVCEVSGKKLGRVPLHEFSEHGWVAIRFSNGKARCFCEEHGKKANEVMMEYVFMNGEVIR